MIFTQESISLLYIAIGFALGGWIFGALWPQARREAFQQDLFRLRNDLFLFIAERNLPFDDLGYRHLRKKLNVMIRRAEHFNILTLLILAAMTSPEQETSPVDEAMNPVLRDELRRVEIEAGRRVASFLTWSVLGAPGMLLFQLIAMIRWRHSMRLSEFG